MTKLRPKTCGVWTTKTYSQLGRENEQLHHEISYYESLVDDDNETDWPHRDRRFRDWLQQRLQRLAAAEALCERYKAEFDRALDAVDVVFQKHKGNPEPILPDFCKLGEDKFATVPKLAKAYKSTREEIETANRENAKLRKELAEAKAALESRPTYGTSQCGHSERFLDWEHHGSPIVCLKCECGKLQLQCDTWEYTVDKLQNRLAAAEAVSQRFPQLLSLCERMVAAYGVLLEHYRRSQEQLAANGPGELSENPGELPSTGRPVMNGEPKIDKK